MISHLKNLDWILIITVFFICIFGLLSLYSSSFAKDSFLNFQKQLLFVGVGFFLMAGISFFDYRALKQNSLFLLLFYLIFLLALALLFVFGDKIRGVYSWFRLGNFSFEPIEFMKLALVLVLAKYFSMRHIEMYRPFHIIISGIYVALPAFLVFLQPDIGSAAIIVVLWIGIMIIVGIKLRHLAFLSLIGILTSLFSWIFVLRDYQKDRIFAFLNPYFDPIGRGYNAIQSLIAVGSGGIFGMGLGYGSQVQYNFLPEAQTDFIFSAISEEFGFLGVFILLTLFIILFYRIIKIILGASNNFARLCAAGIILWIFFQIVINIGMNIGIFPITGIPLPFLSYGGSSLIALFLGLGLLQSIKVNG